MSKIDSRKGAILAAAAAALFVTAPAAVNAGAHDQGEATGHCVGANACKGQSACATANSSCKGQNACKGQGWTETTKAECDEAGGEFEEA
jgi:phosphate/sulfate permease